LLDELDPERRLVGVTPRGPLSLPPGGAHWYAVRRIGYPDPGTFDATYGLLSSWIDALGDELGVPIARTVIGGFSQGAVMSYALGLGRGRPAPAGIIALSGFMPTVEGFALDLADRENLPVEIRSPTTWRYDVGRKKSAYEREGLSELWLVDLGAVLVYRRSGASASGFDVELELAPSDRLGSPFLLGFGLELRELYEEAWAAP